SQITPARRRDHHVRSRVTRPLTLRLLRQPRRGTLPLPFRVLRIDHETPDRRYLLERQRVHACCWCDDHLPYEGRLTEALVAGDDDPVLAFEEARDHPVRFLLGDRQDVSQRLHLEASPPSFREPRFHVLHDRLRIKPGLAELRQTLREYQP